MDKEDIARRQFEVMQDMRNAWPTGSGYMRGDAGTANFWYEVSEAMPITQPPTVPPTLRERLKRWAKALYVTVTS